MNPKVDELDEFGEPLEPQGSLSSSDGKSIEDVTDVKKLVSELETVKKELRGLQGRQDKSENAYQPLLVEYERQKAKGLTNNEAMEAAQTTMDRRAKAQKQELLLKQIAEKLGLDSTSPLVSGNTKGIATEYEKVIKAHGLDANDAEVIALMRESGSALDFSINASKLTARKQSAPNPDQSQSPAKVFEPQPTPDGNALIGEYKQKVMANRGNKAMIDALKAEYAQKGVPVNSVNFSL